MQNIFYLCNSFLEKGEQPTDRPIWNVTLQVSASVCACCVYLSILFFCSMFAFLNMFCLLNIPLSPLIRFMLCAMVWGDSPQIDLFQTRLYKLLVLLVGGEKALCTKKMRWILYCSASTLYIIAILKQVYNIDPLQVFLDIVESVNLLMSSKGGSWILIVSVLIFARFPANCFMVLGVVLRCDVTGKILMKCFLSGMPDLKLGLNDKIGLEKESQLKSRPTKR